MGKKLQKILRLRDWLMISVENNCTQAVWAKTYLWMKSLSWAGSLDGNKIKRACVMLQIRNRKLIFSAWMWLFWTLYLGIADHWAIAQSTKGVIISSLFLPSFLPSTFLLFCLYTSRTVAFWVKGGCKSNVRSSCSSPCWRRPLLIWGLWWW